MKVLLKDIADIKAGQGAPQGDEKYSTNGIPFIKAGNLHQLLNGFSVDKLQKVSNDVASQYKLKLYPKGTILFAKSGMSCMKGYVYVLPCNAYVVNHLACIIPYGNYSEYLKYYLNYHKPSYLIKDNSYPSISLKDIGNQVIDFKSKKIQKEIIKQMKLLEQNISCLKIVGKKYDDLIKARFIEMFGNESNPFDWPIVTVDSVADVQVGVVIKPAQYYADRINGIKTFRSLNVGEMNVKDTNWVYFSEEGNRKNIKSILKEHDLLIIRSGAPGTACVIEKQYEGCNAIDLIIAHPNKKYINPYYLCMFTNSALGKRQIDEGTGGAAQQHFNVGKYKKMKIFYPPMAKQQDFECFFKQVDKSRFNIKKSIIELEREVVYD